MASRPPLTVVGFIRLKDGRTIRVEEMTDEERARVRKSMNERLSRQMSLYYSQHPDEFDRLDAPYVDSDGNIIENT